MKRRHFLRLSIIAIALVFGGVTDGATAQFKFPGQTLTVPDGFEVELIAGPPLVDRPIVADFDEAGRLYVADSAGVNDKVEKQLEEKPHRILRLEDTDGDGRFDKRTVFADKMMFPEGILWYDGAVYSGAPPSIWKLEDTDNDGVADRRSEWFKGLTLGGCANDLHGPYLGPDGFIYWAKGGFAKQTHQRPGRPTIEDSAAHIFRCLPDGSEFDSLMSGGMDNPVDVVFTPAGEAIFTTTFYTNPQGGQRDALVHAVYGGVYPKVHGVLNGLKRTGDLMPALSHLGPAAPCGLARYASRVFGDDFEGNLFSCQFNLHKVQRHILETKGSTFQTRDSDFLMSDHPDFHPTDVLEDADGSLIVIDTGGWYKLCCPTSVIARPDVLGGIYRIRRRGAPAVSDPRGGKLEWAAMDAERLTALLDDRRPAVRERAIQALAKKGEAAVPALTQCLQPNRPIEQRRNAVWALTRIDGLTARKAARAALSDSDDSVQQAAVHSAGIRRDSAAGSALLVILHSSSPHLSRHAATALGQLGDRKAVPALLTASSMPRDRFLEHALIYALIQIGDRAATAASLNAPSVLTRRAALIALDQMDGGDLKSAEVVPLLTSADPILRETAVWIAGHRPDWGQDLASFLEERLVRRDLGAADRAELTRQLAPLAQNGVIQELMAQRLGNGETPTESRLLLLGVIGQSSSKELPATWMTQLEHCLAETNHAILRGAIAAIRSLPAQKKTNALPDLLGRLAQDGSLPRDLRLDALAASPGKIELISPAVFDFLLETLDPKQPLLERSNAAGILGRTKLDTNQLQSVLEKFGVVGPLELTRLLGAFEGANDESLGLKLVTALKQSPGLARVAPDLLQARLKSFPPSVREQGNDLFRLLNLDLARQKARLDDLQVEAARGDSRRGQAVFNSARTACATCHAVGYVGGRLGPDLTRIGSIRTERDLLEAVIFPSASFVRSFEPMVVVTRDGEEFSGVLRDEAAESILLASGPMAEQRIPRSNIAELRPGTVSVMPEGLEQQLDRQELADLVAFLKSLR